jgi:hypothetical protein
MAGRARLRAAPTSQFAGKCRFPAVIRPGPASVGADSLRKALARKFSGGFLTPCGGPGMVREARRTGPVIDCAAAVKGSSEELETSD